MFVAGNIHHKGFRKEAKHSLGLTRFLIKIDKWEYLIRS